MVQEIIMVNHLTSEGLTLIKSYEKCELTVYADQGGKPTVGFGHLVTPDDDLEIGDTVLQEWADEIFLVDLLKIAQIPIQNLITQPINDNQFSALCSLVYNAGQAPLEGTLGKLLNAADYEGACDQFLRWDKYHDADGNLCVSQGLLNRRMAEQKIFEEPIPIHI
jgi:lysozyme